MSEETSGAAATVPEELRGIPAQGAIVGGKFSVEGVLGVGGMGVVLAARHVQLGQRVAIKFLRHDAAKHPEAVNRFLREARAVVGLQSAHVVRVMDVGVLADGLPFMVMEHLHGTDLGEVLRQRKTLPVEEAVDYVLQGMEAIAEAHSVGIVHRDIKPANLFLTARPDGSPLVKVLDFGISKAAETAGAGSTPSLTATSAVMGSPLYMSPEQLRSSKNVDARTDVWALGVILYELVSGAPPFDDETVTGLCAKIVADAPVPLRARRPDVPVAFEAVVMHCLEKDVGKRQQSVGELAAGLRAFASPEARMAVDRIMRMSGGLRPHPVRPEGASSPVSAPSAAPGSTGYADTVATWQTAGLGRRRRMATTVAVSIGATLLAVAGIGFVVRSTHRPQGGAPAPSVAVSAEPALATIPPPPLPSAVLSPPSAVPSAEPSAPVATTSSSPRPPAAVARPSGRPPAAPAKPPSDDLLLDRK